MHTILTTAKEYEARTYLQNCGLLTNIAEENWQKDESMRCTKYNHTEVHAEVEHLEELRLGEGQYNDTNQLGQCDTTEYLKKYKHFIYD